MVVDAELAPAQPVGGAAEAYDPAAAAVLAVLEHGTDEHIEAVRPRRTKISYARD
ncbi:hypothetical protein [Streptomyces orinoci]|uniref:Uncharacterized protein n=1 Tax=Streptomyces orinoci TaxID=67339 RepID=A0ABV3K0K1_STRON|nr:hypothetical protein [Streptomyces orinoci]